MRPELTHRTAANLLEWSGTSRLRIVIDGLRDSAQSEETYWRNETIRCAENIAGTDSRVEIEVFSKNIGFTNHCLRVQKLIFGSSDSGIMLEEDNNISTFGLNFLKENIATAIGPAVFTSYSSSNHAGNTLDSKFRRTLFGQLWGNAINESAHYALEKAWREKTVDAQMINRRIQDLIQPRNLNERDFASRTSKYWCRYFLNGLISPRHTDIALMYAIWDCNGTIGAPLRNLSEDLSYLDFRGMNQRNKPRVIGKHELSPKVTKLEGFCLQCEIIDSRVTYGILKSKLNSFKYRLSKLKE